MMMGHSSLGRGTRIVIPGRVSSVVVVRKTPPAVLVVTVRSTPLLLLLGMGIRWRWHVYYSYVGPHEWGSKVGSTKVFCSVNGRPLLDG